MIEWLDSLLAWAAGNPMLLFAAIFIGTFILEDAATVAAALLAAAGEISVGLAITALYLGIGFGDLALYGAGRLAAQQSWARRWVDHERTNVIRGWASDKLISAVFTSRFVPGLRTPTFTGIGFLGLPFLTFAIGVVAAVLVWTSLLFTLIYQFGSMVLDELGPWKWAAAAGLILLIIVVERLVSRRISHQGSS